MQRQASLFMLCVLILLALCASCIPLSTRKYTPKNEAPAEEDLMPMPRADPAYLQYLERQSMLAQSADMAKIVSGSELAWQASASSGTPDAMLNFADNWLFVHPLTILTSSRSATFSQLTNTSTWPILREIGVRGLYIAPVQGSGAIWAKGRSGMDTGEDVVQYGFSPAAGKEAEYNRLMNGVIQNNCLVGSDLVPAATGLGPDFFLAARNVREFPGIYCMVEIPEKLWKHLPDVTSEWEGAALGEAQIAALSDEGLLPKAMRDDVSPLARISGWAATGVIRGVDGNNYRWVYRYNENPDFAVLNWEDPSQTAHRILSGSAVRQVGMQGQALLGLRFEAFQGLEAASDVHPGFSSMEPALTAAQSMSREVRRYGGWSWLRDDDLSLSNVRDFLSSGVDFIYDSVFSPGAEHALLTGDASLLRFMTDEALRLRIDTRRLVHTMPGQDGINYSLPHLYSISGEQAASFRRSVQASMRTAAAKASPAPVKKNYLYSTAAGLAALALDAPSTSSATSRVEEIEQGHRLLILFKSMQPGVMMLAGQDLSGVLPLQWDGMVSGNTTFSPQFSSRGAYGLTAANSGLSVSAQGVPKAPALYAAPDLQVHTPDSFLSKIGTFLRIRTELGIAKGTLIARHETKGKGSIALLTRLPNGKSYVLCICNFSRDTVTETIPLAGDPGLTSALERVTLAKGGKYTVEGESIVLTLGPWEGRAILIGSDVEQAEQGEEHTSMEDEKVTPIPVVADLPPSPEKAEAPGQSISGENLDQSDTREKGESGPQPAQAKAPVAEKKEK